MPKVSKAVFAWAEDRMRMGRGPYALTRSAARPLTALTHPLAMSTLLAGLRTPALVVDASAASRNAAAMRARAASRGVALRPHLKTHKARPSSLGPPSLGDLGPNVLGRALGRGGRMQTVEGALLQVDGDRTRPCVVSTLGEARWFAKQGFNEVRRRRRR